MAEPVATLLERGLRHYALGEIERAVACWREALERDPASARAREYLTLVRASVPSVVALPPSRRSPGPARAANVVAAGTAGNVAVTARPARPPPPPPPDLTPA